MKRYEIESVVDLAKEAMSMSYDDHISVDRKTFVIDYIERNINDRLYVIRKARKNERLKRRYRDDADYREKLKSKSAERYSMLSADDSYMEMLRNRNRENYKTKRLKATEESMRKRKEIKNLLHK